MRLDGVGFGEVKSYQNQNTGFQASLTGDGNVDAAVTSAYLARKPADSFVPTIFAERIQDLIMDSVHRAEAHRAVKADRTDDAWFTELGAAKQDFAQGALAQLPGWGHPLVGYRTHEPLEWQISADNYSEAQGSAHQFITVDTGSSEVWMRTNTGGNHGQPGYVHWISAHYDPATGGILRETVSEALEAEPPKA